MQVRGGGAGGFDAGADVIVPYLQRQGARRLEMIVLTHPHQDHWGGLAAVITSLPVGGIILPPAFPPEDFGIPPDVNLPLYRASAGSRMDLGQGINLLVLHPPVQLLTGTESDLNNNSLVIYLRKGGVAFLLAGDDVAISDII